MYFGIHATTWIKPLKLLGITEDMDIHLNDQDWNTELKKSRGWDGKRIQGSNQPYLESSGLASTFTSNWEIVAGNMQYPRVT